MTNINAVPPIPIRPVEGHKGLFGRVLVVGGSDGMIGAPVLAGTAALRTGSGLVQIAVPRAILHACLSITPELIGLGLGEKLKRLLEAAEQADVLVVGPGMGRDADARARVKRLLKLDKPMVVDADALNILAQEKTWPASFVAKAVLTPHPGEMKRLAKFLDRDSVPDDDDGRINIAIAASKAFTQIIVLKGHRTVVTDGERVYVNHTGDSSLSKAGTGDVLSGMIASLIGQGMELFEAACLGAHLHGRAGEISGKKLGMRSVLARDVIGAIAEAMGRSDARKVAAVAL